MCERQGDRPHREVVERIRHPRPTGTLDATPSEWITVEAPASRSCPPSCGRRRKPDWIRPVARRDPERAEGWLGWLALTAGRLSRAERCGGDSLTPHPRSDPRQRIGSVKPRCARPSMVLVSPHVSGGARDPVVAVVTVIGSISIHPRAPAVPDDRRVSSRRSRRRCRSRVLRSRGSCALRSHGAPGLCRARRSARGHACRWRPWARSRRHAPREAR